MPVDEVINVYPPEIWARESLLVLEKELVLARLVHVDFRNDVANFGDVVNTRKPQKLTAKDWAGQAGTPGLANDEIEVQRPQAANHAVTLNKHKYTSFMEEDRPAATSIKELSEEFIVPAVSPIAEAVDSDLVTEFRSGTDWNAAGVATVTVTGGFSAAEIIDARLQMNTTLAPQIGRVLVLHHEHEAEALADALFVQAQQAGNVDALENARLGRKFGFDIFMSQNLAGTAGTAESYAFHPFAIALVVRPLRPVPQGYGAISATVSHKNVSVRVVASYNNRGMGIDHKFDTLYGVKLLDAALGKKCIG